MSVLDLIYWCRDLNNASRSLTEVVLYLSCCQSKRSILSSVCVRAQIDLELTSPKRDADALIKLNELYCFLRPFETIFLYNCNDTKKCYNVSILNAYQGNKGEKEGKEDDGSVRTTTRTVKTNDSLPSC